MGGIRQSLKHARKIKSSQIRKRAEQEFAICFIGRDEMDRAALLRVFLPEGTPRAERDRAVGFIRSTLATSETRTQPDEIAVWTEAAAAQAGIAADEHAIVKLDAPQAGWEKLLRLHPQLGLALGRTFSVLRPLVARHRIEAAAMRNAAFAAMSAIPEVVPTPLSLVWAAGEFASDTVVLTANQFRLAFELAALTGDAVGWSRQSGQLMAILASAFGWRALARELVSLIPAGAGLVAKSGIAYGGTYAVGQSLWQYEMRRQAEPQAREARYTLPASA